MNVKREMTLIPHCCSYALDKEQKAGGLHLFFFRDFEKSKKQKAKAKSKKQKCSTSSFVLYYGCFLLFAFCFFWIKLLGL